MATRTRRKAARKKAARKTARPARPASRKPSRARKTRKAARPARRTRRPALSRPSRRTAGQALPTTAGIPAELDFERGDERDGRIGDRRGLDEQREQFPGVRVREAGMTAGETPHPERNTADDAAPDTLLDDEGGQAPADQRGPRAADTALSVVDESAIGAGGGTDEAEDAQRDPISQEELRRIRKRVARAGGDITSLEPNESRAGSPGRARNR